MTTVMTAVLLLVLDRRTQAVVAVLAALATGLLLGPGEAAAHVRGGG